MSSNRVERVMRRGLPVAGAISLAQALILAGGWLAVYQDTHEEVAKGVEDVIVKSSVATAKAVTRVFDGLPPEEVPGSEGWVATQEVILVTLTAALAMFLTRAHARTMQQRSSSLEATVAERTQQLVHSHRSVPCGGTATSTFARTSSCPGRHRPVPPRERGIGAQS